MENSLKVLNLERYWKEKHLFDYHISDVSYIELISI